MSQQTIDAQQFADMILQNYWTDVYPVDPVAIARRFDIKVYYTDLPQDVSGALIKTDEMDAPVIMVDQSELDVRKRFTVAHELGHYVYNTFVAELSGGYNKIDFRNQKSKQGNDKEEIFANSFAAALLMPKNAMLQYQAQSVFSLSALFDVSPEALRYRKTNLGL